MGDCNNNGAVFIKAIVFLVIAMFAAYSVSMFVGLIINSVLGTPSDSALMTVGLLVIAIFIYFMYRTSFLKELAASERTAKTAALMVFSGVVALLIWGVREIVGSCC